MVRYCGSCGTEVDETAVFCPTCGSPIEEGDAHDLPPAPSWPDPATDLEPPPPAVPSAPGTVDRDPWGPATDLPEPEPPPVDREEPASFRAPAVEAAPTRVEPRPDAVEPDPRDERRDDTSATDRRDAGSPARERPAGGGGIDLPITPPVTLSGWLIGAGSAVGALGIIVILLTSRINVIDLLLLLALVGIAATVFAAARMPAIPQLRLITLVAVLIAFGVALDRLGFRAAGVGELLLFLGTAAAAIGAVLLELGRDQPLGPQR